DGITDGTRRLRERMSAWVAAETAPGRLLPWIPVAFGFGIVAYFAADREPAWWASAASAIAAIVAAYLAQGELEPVFSAMLENAVRICEAKFGTMLRAEEDGYRVVAMHGPPPAYAAERRRNPVLRVAASRPL